MTAIAWPSAIISPRGARGSRHELQGEHEVPRLIKHELLLTETFSTQPAGSIIRSRRSCGREKIEEVRTRSRRLIAAARKAYRPVFLRDCAPPNATLSWNSFGDIYFTTRVVREHLIRNGQSRVALRSSREFYSITGEGRKGGGGENIDEIEFWRLCFSRTTQRFGIEERRN